MRTFFDSNVLVYAADPRDPMKMEKAGSFIAAALCGEADCVIAVQTLAEFVNVAIKKLKKPTDEILEFIENYRQLKIVKPDGEIVARGFEIKNRYDIQFYDAMMLATAERAGADEFYTEDLNDGQFYGSVRAVNPFK